MVGCSSVSCVIQRHIVPTIFLVVLMWDALNTKYLWFLFVSNSFKLALRNEVLIALYFPSGTIIKHENVFNKGWDRDRQMLCGSKGRSINFFTLFNERSPPTWRNSECDCYYFVINQLFTSSKLTLRRFLSKNIWWEKSAVNRSSAWTPRELNCWIIGYNISLQRSYFGCSGTVFFP